MISFLPKRPCLWGDTLALGVRLIVGLLTALILAGELPCARAVHRHQNARDVASPQRERGVRPWDKYGRLLAYVYVGNNMVNPEPVRLGYAQVATFPPNVKSQERFLTLQRDAREAERDLWGAK
jgi:hypothetical protein